MTKGLATLAMLLVCTVCLGLVLGPSYAIFGVVALVAFMGVWALVEDFNKDKEQDAAEKRSDAWLHPRAGETAEQALARVRRAFMDGEG